MNTFFSRLYTVNCWLLRCCDCLMSIVRLSVRRNLTFLCYSQKSIWSILYPQSIVGLKDKKYFKQKVMFSSNRGEMKYRKCVCVRRRQYMYYFFKISTEVFNIADSFWHMSNACMFRLQIRYKIWAVACDRGTVFNF